MSDSIQPAITIQVPATTANLGVGFDTFGLALTLHNTFAFTKAEAFSFKTSTHSPISLPTIAPQAHCPNQLIFSTMNRFYEAIHKPLKPIAVEATVNIPLGRGLGSSATAVVGTLVGINALEGNLLSTQEILALAIAIEGHPDNVAPALLGGFQLCDATRATPLKWWCEWQFLAIIPTFQTETEASRNSLPEHYSRADVVSALRHSALFIQAVQTKNAKLLKTIFEQDAIHEPFRGSAIPHFETIRGALTQHPNVLGTVVSGSGPTLLIAFEQAATTEITEQVQALASPLGLTVLPLKAEKQGAIVL
jgi:homoserine kinase